MKVIVPLAKNVLAPLATMAPTSAINDDIQREMRGKGVVRARKGITLVVSNEDMDNIIRIIKSLENSGILIDGVRARSSLTCSLKHVRDMTIT